MVNKRLEHLAWKVKRYQQTEEMQLRTMARLREGIATETDPRRKAGLQARLAEAEKTFAGFKRVQERLERDYAEAASDTIVYNTKGQEE